MSIVASHLAYIPLVAYVKALKGLSLAIITHHRCHFLIDLKSESVATSPVSCKWKPGSENKKRLINTWHGKCNGEICNRHLLFHTWRPHRAHKREHLRGYAGGDNASHRAHE